MDRKESLEEENLRLRQRVSELEEKLRQAEQAQTAEADVVREQELLDGTFTLPPLPRYDRLTLEDIRRYSRQLLMHEVGVEGADMCIVVDV